MDNEDFYRAHDLVSTLSATLAAKHVESLNLPDAVEFAPDSVKPLGAKFYDRAERTYSSLSGEYEDLFPYLTGYAIRRMWFSLWKGAYYFIEGAKHGVVGDNDYCRGFMTAEGYASHQGYANALYEGLSEPGEPEFLSSWRTKFNVLEQPNISDVLSAAFLHFLGKAADSIKLQPNDTTMGWLYEATDAFALAEGEYMWSASKEHHTKDQHKDVRASFARKGSDARHASNREAKIKVFSWCDENMSRFKSMDDAAFDIAETFVSQKFRTVREWMTEWNKLRSSGKP